MDLAGMHRTDCFGRQDMSCLCLAHHEPATINTIIPTRVCNEPLVATMETTYYLQAVRARFQLPLGAIAHPFADPPEGSPLPVIQLENYGIIRCRRCRTYINPFIIWSEDGRSVLNPKFKVQY